MFGYRKEVVPERIHRKSELSPDVQSEYTVSMQHIYGRRPEDTPTIRRLSSGMERGL